MFRIIPIIFAFACFLGFDSRAVQAESLHVDSLSVGIPYRVVSRGASFAEIYRFSLSNTTDHEITVSQLAVNFLGNPEALSGAVFLRGNLDLASLDQIGYTSVDYSGKALLGQPEESLFTIASGEVANIFVYGEVSPGAPLGSSFTPAIFSGDILIKQGFNDAAEDDVGPFPLFGATITVLDQQPIDIQDEFFGGIFNQNGGEKVLVTNNHYISRLEVVGAPAETFIAATLKKGGKDIQSFPRVATKEGPFSVSYTFKKGTPAGSGYSLEYCLESLTGYAYACASGESFSLRSTSVALSDDSSVDVKRSKTKAQKAKKKVVRHVVKRTAKKIIRRN